MIEQLFGSKTRVKLLKLFFSNPNRSFYVREITRTIDEQINSVRRELANLLSLGLITSDSTNNKLYYEVDQSYEYFDALQAMFAEKTSKTIKKTAKKMKEEGNTDSEVPEVAQQTSQDVELPEAKRWKSAGNVSGIIYSGVYTRDDAAPIDILVIGDVTVPAVEAVIEQLEKEKNRELRYAIIEASEWRYRSQVRDKFWLQVMGAKNQVVLERDSLFTVK